MVVLILLHSANFTLQCPQTYFKQNIYLISKLLKHQLVCDDEIQITRQPFCVTTWVKQSKQKSAICSKQTPPPSPRTINPKFFFLFFLQSATTWLAQPLPSNYLYSVLLSSNCFCLCSSYLPKVIFPKCFRSSNWSFRHGFPSLDLLHIIIFGHAFNMA